ncbi:hypothetical protein BDZ94DRAFT_1249709 [Collybia nuda]|uniref:SHSP domain-containing protein n=1 Tax=Collybia nuda TaxID=64659 RepID=A0A9P5YEQ7_9AGAR|nr:hypothetical protein BDZ94DRAFT_1249709 [Collybia nuda]
MSHQNNSPIASNPKEGQPQTRVPNVPHTTPSSMLPFLNDPDFKRLVAQQVDFVCKQAVKSGRIRVIRQSPTPVFIPRMDIVDDPSCPRFVATFELPGVRHNEVTLQIQEGSLVVDGERRLRVRSQSNTPQSSNNGASTQRDSLNHKVRIPIQELRYGKFRRLVGLPHGTKV